MADKLPKNARRGPRIDPRAEPSEEELAELERSALDDRPEASDAASPKSTRTIAASPAAPALEQAASPEAAAVAQAAPPKTATLDRAVSPKTDVVDPRAEPSEDELERAERDARREAPEAAPPRSTVTIAASPKAVTVDRAPSPKTAAVDRAAAPEIAAVAPTAAPKPDTAHRAASPEIETETIDARALDLADRPVAADGGARDSSARVDELDELRLALTAVEMERDALAMTLASEREVMRVEREGVAAARRELEEREEEKRAAVVPPIPLAALAPAQASPAAAVVGAAGLGSVAVSGAGVGVGVGPFLDTGGIGIAGTLGETLKMAMRVVPWKLVARGASVMMFPALLYANRGDIKKTSDRMKNIPKVVISARIAGDIATELEASSINAPLPRRRDFVAWVRKNYKGLPGTDPARDQWGTLFRLDEAPRMLGVRSAGPDRRFDTKDDIFRGVRDMGFNRM